MDILVDFNHSESIVMLKVGCTLPKLDLFLHSSENEKFYPVKESDKALLSKVREGIIGCLSAMFTPKSAIDESHSQEYTIN